MIIVNHFPKGPILKITFKTEFIVMVPYIILRRFDHTVGGNVNGNNVFSFFLFLKKIIYFIFGCVGSLLLHAGFL